MRQGPFPNIVQQSDAALNDSDKTFTVPAGKAWRLQMLMASLISTATVGNRQIKVVIGDGTNILWSKNFGAVQAASLTRQYFGAADLPNDAAFDADGNIRMALYQWVLPPGYTVRVYDSAAIAAAADDMTVRLLVEEMTE
ncbi:MAG: hypothetical protein HW375_46 [Anaerolineales bacterium]|nr:hypothetical protein [Anaerolineales bacterium]